MMTIDDIIKELGYEVIDEMDSIFAAATYKDLLEWQKIFLTEERTTEEEEFAAPIALVYFQDNLRAALACSEWEIV